MPALRVRGDRARLEAEVGGALDREAGAQIGGHVEVGKAHPRSALHPDALGRGAGDAQAGDLHVADVHELERLPAPAASATTPGSAATKRIGAAGVPDV